MSAVAQTEQVDQGESSISDLKVKALPAGFRIDVDNWLMAQHIEWTKALQPETFSFETLNKNMATGIKSWPYFKSVGSANDVESYGKLTPKQWKTCLNAVSEAVNNTFLD